MTLAPRIGREVGVFLIDVSPEVEVFDCREKGLDVSGEAVDVSTGDDDGVRKLLATAGQTEVNLTLSGVQNKEQLLPTMFAGNRIRTLEIRYPSGSTISGDFFMAKYGEGNPYKGEATWSAEFMSAGAIEFSPGTP